MAAVVTDVSKDIVLKYADNGSYRFSRIIPTATDQQLYNLAETLNSFQADPMKQVVKVHTQLIV